MVQSNVSKLAALLDDAELAAELVQAGLDTPAKIKAAKAKDIEAAVGKSKSDRVRTRFGKK